MVNTKDKDRFAYEMRKKGAKLKEIAGTEVFGEVSVSVIRQRIKRHIYSIENYDELCALSTRSVNALKRAGINTKKELVDKLSSCEYWWLEFKKIAGLGVGSYNEICDFAGFPDKKHKKGGNDRCHCCGQFIKK